MITTLLLALVLQVPGPVAVMQPGCVIAQVHKGDGMAGLFPDQAHVMKASQTRTVYLCDAFYGMGSVMRITVRKPWFAAHCHQGSNLAGGLAATCDEVFLGAGDPAPIREAAAPPSKFREHLKEFGYAALGVVAAAVYIAAGVGPR